LPGDFGDALATVSVNVWSRENYAAGVPLVHCIYTKPAFGCIRWPKPAKSGKNVEIRLLIRQEHAFLCAGPREQNHAAGQLLMFFCSPKWLNACSFWP